MSYIELINKIRKYIEHTAVALNDGTASVTVALVGFLSALPEGLALYLTASSVIGPAFATMLSVALPAISVGCVYVAVTKRSSGMWVAFVFQLLISIGLTYLLGGTWEILLPMATGVGAYVASTGQAQQVSAKAERDDIAWQREQDALDRQAERDAKLLQEQTKAKVKLAKAEQLDRNTDKKVDRNTDKKVDRNTDKIPKPDRARQLNSEGLSASDIAEMLGVTDRTVRRYLAAKVSADVQTVVHTNGVVRHST